MQINNVHQFFFHPLSENHTTKVKVLSIITLVALSILTGFIYLFAFITVNLKDRIAKKPVKKININATEAILRNEHGFSYSENEPHKHFLHGFIGPTQGHDKFRSHVAKITQQDMDALNPKSLREKRHINPFLSIALSTKRLGHALNLRGNLVFEDKKINFEGFSEVFTIPMLSEVFKKCANENPHLITLEIKQWVIEHFTQTTCCDALTENQIEDFRKMLNDPNFEGPLCVSTGYDWHVTFIIFYRNFVFYINLGAEQFALNADGEYVENFSGAGISIFKTAHHFNLSSKTASLIFNRMLSNRNNSLKIKDLQKELNLQFLDIIREKNQEVGNCAYQNAIRAILTLIALFYIKDKEKITTPDLDEPFDKAKIICEELVKFDQNYLIKDLLDEIQPLRNIKEKDEQVYRVLNELLDIIIKKNPRIENSLMSELKRLHATKD